MVIIEEIVSPTMPIFKIILVSKLEETIKKPRENI